MYDTCGKAEMAQKTIVSSLVEARCKQQYLIGNDIEEKNFKLISILIECISDVLVIHLFIDCVLRTEFPLSFLLFY